MMQRKQAYGRNLLLRSLPADAPDTPDAFIAPFVVPIQINDGHIEVTGSLNGKPARFVLDTGATVTVLTTDAVPRFGLSLENEAVTGHGTGGDVTVRPLCV